MTIIKEAIKAQRKFILSNVEGRNLLISLIELYQKTVSPDHGPLRHNHPFGFCPQHPTCSEYAKEVIRKRGVLVGLGLTFKRVLSCHPWKKPDPERVLSTL